MAEQFTSEAVEEMRGCAALLANLEGIGSGEMQATLAELQALGSTLLALLDGEEA